MEWSSSEVTWTHDITVVKHYTTKKKKSTFFPTRYCSRGSGGTCPPCLLDEGASGTVDEPLQEFSPTAEQKTYGAMAVAQVAGQFLELLEHQGQESSGISVS